MTKQKKRSKLLKLLSKEVTYTATLIRFSRTNGLLVKVCHKGKEVTDHVWVKASKKLLSFPEGTELLFKATAYTYRDNADERKYGLNNVYNYCPNNGATETLIHDKKYSAQRQWRK